jgi:hypothetical protein
MPFFICGHVMPKEQNSTVSAFIKKASAVLAIALTESYGCWLTVYLAMLSLYYSW